MILVTGTKRSGTSLWMQILVAAGFPYIGAPFLGKWEQSIGPANPRGFFESPLRRGVYYATNPDPRSGAFLFPAATKRHAVKVFIPGLIRTDYAYIDRVVASIRPWREYCASIQRLYAMEDEFLAGLPPDLGHEGELVQPLERARRSRGALHPALEWWFENYELVRDLATRRYPINLVSYQRLLERPRETIGPVLEWLGGGDLEAAVAAVEPQLCTQRDVSAEAPLDADAISVFDALHEAVHRDQALSRELIEAMNALHERLEARWLPGRSAAPDVVQAEGVPIEPE